VGPLASRCRRVWTFDTFLATQERLGQTDRDASGRSGAVSEAGRGHPKHVRNKEIHAPEGQKGMVRPAGLEPAACGLGRHGSYRKSMQNNGLRGHFWVKMRLTSGFEVTEQSLTSGHQVTTDPLSDPPYTAYEMHEELGRDCSVDHISPVAGFFPRSGTVGLFSLNLRACQERPRGQSAVRAALRSGE
jgi:hypothetical protein